MKYKHLREHARGAKDTILFSEELDRWGATTLTATYQGEAFAVVQGLQSLVAIKAAKRRLGAEFAREWKEKNG